MKSLPVLKLAFLVVLLSPVLLTHAQGLPSGAPTPTVDQGSQLEMRVAPPKPVSTFVHSGHAQDRILIKFAEGSQVRWRQNRIVSLGGVDFSRLEETLMGYGIFLSEFVRHLDLPESDVDAIKARGELLSGRELADLNNYYTLAVPDGLDIGLLCDALNRLSVVELAAPVSVPAELPQVSGPVTGDYSGMQGYRAFLGLTEHRDVNGIDGTGTAFVDIEYDWILDHEDLGLPPETNIDDATLVSPYEDDANHGAAVLGVIVGGDNGYGVTGLAPAATPYVVPANTLEYGLNIERAIALATLRLSAGDVILLEQQYHVCGGQAGGPVEWIPSVYDAIETAIANGITVVEAAGNGSINLDDPLCNSRFDRATRDSGAIMVGAGKKTNRSRLYFSSYGNRVDVQGWGLGVVTTGYGDFDAGIPADARQGYTRYFSGTSSASAMVTGVVLAIQGARKALGLEPLAPLEVRQLLVDTGAPQTGLDPIGPLPNVAAALGLESYLNDDLAEARPLSALPASEVGANVNATSETGEPSHAGDPGGASVWWQWTASRDGVATADTFGSSFNTLLAVYTGASIDALSAVAQNDDTVDALGDMQSQVTFSVTAGENYFIAVDGAGGLQGEIRLSLQFDSDGDGVYDHLDNCISVANPGQEPSSIDPDCGEACVMSGCSETGCENR